MKHELYTPETAIQLQRLFANAPQTWRTVAVKHALLEFAATISSVLNSARGTRLLDVTQTEEYLLQLASQLLTEAVRAHHREQVLAVAAQIALGQRVDLIQLINAAEADLAVVDAIESGDWGTGE